jgi:predicted nucleic acid-binding protein
VILVDTSAWIAFFRDAGSVAESVDAALSQNQVAWCGPIATELRRGFVSPRERTKVLHLLQGCHWLEQPHALWQEAGDLGYALRRRGVTVKTLDLLIATYALTHQAELLTLDADFGSMRSKGVPLQLVLLRQ